MSFQSSPANDLSVGINTDVCFGASHTDAFYSQRTEMDS